MIRFEIFGEQHLLAFPRRAFSRFSHPLTIVPSWFRVGYCIFLRLLMLLKMTTTTLARMLGRPLPVTRRMAVRFSLQSRASSAFDLSFPCCCRLICGRKTIHPSSVVVWMSFPLLADNVARFPTDNYDAVCGRFLIVCVASIQIWLVGWLVGLVRPLVVVLLSGNCWAICNLRNGLLTDRRSKFVKIHTTGS